MPPRSEHVPVMLAEVLAWLDPQPGQIFVDGTLGGGGHTRAIAERVGPSGLVIALDRDLAAVERRGPSWRTHPSAQCKRIIGIWPKS